MRMNIGASRTLHTAGLLFLVSLLLLGGAGPGAGQTASAGFLDVGDGRIYYEVAGAGEAIVFLHDGLTHSGIWDPQFRRLAERFRVVRYDRRG